MSSNCKAGKQKRRALYLFVGITNDVIVLHSHQALLCSVNLLRCSMRAKRQKKNSAMEAVAPAAALGPPE
jgi:hypothetical protein